MPATIAELIAKAHNNSIAHGFWDTADDKSIAAKLLLIHSEISEATEEFRASRGLSTTYTNGGTSKPEGFPVELADAVIRIFDLCGHLCIDLEAAILSKMAYNETRPLRHGGKRI